MKKIIFSKNEGTKEIAHFFIRLVFGTFLVINGWDKLANFSAYAADFLDPFSVGRHVSLGLVIFAELGCGLCITLGLLTRIAVVPVFITFVIATFIAHSQDGFALKQTAMLYLFLSVYFMLTGSGNYSLDEEIQNAYRKTDDRTSIA